MVILGLLILLLGVLGVLGGLFGTGYENDKETTSYVGVDVTPEVIFILGIISALLVVAGLWTMKTGAKQGWRRRREHKRLGELSEKLDRVESERRRDDLSGREDTT
ncbi:MULTISPECIES: hypothetical protein [Nocardioides]|uniref:LapA family protein n=1 Tax=Nocardioides vastitatis TaxID=2568655 RepID=A0ABW0ZL17_9ACTN|nr:hypothetical protein [Nocardioides sp.]THI95393.1 hypothetical protein E7Z54_19290 [Nocardioides sp.]